MRERLFDVNILAGFTSHDHGDGVPMVRSGDNYRLDVLVVENGAKVLEAFGFAVSKLESAVQVRHERIGYGNGIDLAGSQKILQVVLTHSAGANQADANPIICAQNRPCERPSRGKHANRGTSQSLVKVPSSYLRVGHFLYYLLFRFARGRRGTGHWRPEIFSRELRPTAEIKSKADPRRRGSGRGLERKSRRAAGPTKV